MTNIYAKSLCKESVTTKGVDRKNKHKLQKHIKDDLWLSQKGHRIMGFLTEEI